MRGLCQIRRTALGVLAAIASIVLVLPAAASAFDFEVDGYYRNRWRYYHDGSIGRAPSFTIQDPADLEDVDQRIPAVQGRTTEFLDQRLMVNARLGITEDIRLYSQFRILSNVLFGDNAGDAPADLPGIGGSLFSQEVDDTLRSGEQIDDIKVERVWAEVDWRPFSLHFGRQGSHWGMGLFQDQGNELDWLYAGQGDNFGDTVDRVKLIWHATDRLHLIAAYDRLVERSSVDDTRVRTDVILGVPTLSRAAIGGIDVNRDDVDEGVLAFLYASENVAGGLYNTFRKKSGNDAFLYVADWYGKLHYGIATFETEVIYAETQFSEFSRPPAFPGGPSRDVRVDGSQWGGVLRMDLDGHLADRPVGLRLEWGFASGPGANEFGETVATTTGVPLINPDDPADVAARTTWTPNLFGQDADAFALWSRDFDVDMLLFEEYVGRVKNADYLKLVLHASPVDNVETYVSAMWARAKRPAIIFVREDQVGPETFPNAERIFLASPTFSDEDINVIQEEGLALASRFPGGMITGPLADRVGKRNLGWEFDAGVSWQPMDNFKMEIEGAVLLPGDVFHNSVTRAFVGRASDAIYALSAQWAVMF
ncbi:MAG: hypothetical protein KC466_06535 [Myxococcales bacterium]|nr:hypothetical protein [Myxococcales bacterium]